MTCRQYTKQDTEPGEYGKQLGGKFSPLQRLAEPLSTDSLEKFVYLEVCERGFYIYFSRKTECSVFQNQGELGLAGG